MQHIMWCRLMAVGALAVPVAGCQPGSQPKVREVATLPGVSIDEAVRLPGGQIVLYTVGDSVLAYDVLAGRSTLVTRDFGYQLTVSSAGDRIVFARRTADGGTYFIAVMPIDPSTGTAAGPARRVSSGTGDSPSFSPDGMLIAYAREGPAPVSQNDLAVVPATGGPERILARYDTFINETYWSDDGRWVFAQLGDRHAIERVPAAGGASESVISYPGQAEGSIAGRIAFYRPTVSAQFQGRMAYVAASGAIGEFGIPPGSGWSGRVRSAQSLLTRTTRPSTVHLLSLTDGTVRDLPGARQSRGAVWSPDSRRLALLELTAGHYQIVVLNADGSEPRRYPVTMDPAMVALRWSPDGQLVAYFPWHGAPTLALLDPATGNTRTLVSAPDADYLDLIWRPDGRSIVFVKHSGWPAATHRDVYETALDGTTRQFRNLDHELRFTIFISDRLLLGAADGGRYSLIPTSDGATQQFPVQAGRLPWPGVSNDGKWFLFLRWDRTDRPKVDRRSTSVELVTTSGDSSRTLRLPFGAQFERPQFLPDGRHVILVGNAPGDTASHVFLVPLDGTAPRLLATVLALPYEGRLELSPDGRTLVFTTEGLPTTTVYALDLSPIVRAAGQH